MEEPTLYSGTEFKLLDSAMALFSERGYKGTSIREIIERAGVTRPVLYYYFKNKEDLFCRIVETSFAELDNDLDEVIATSGTCRSKLLAVMSRTFERAERSVGIVRLLLQAIFASPAEGLRLNVTELAEGRLDRVARIIQGGLDSGELCGGDARQLALVFFGLMDMHIIAKVHGPETVLGPDLAKFLVDFFFNGAGGAITSNVTSAFRSAADICRREEGRDAVQNRVAEK